MSISRWSQVHCLVGVPGRAAIALTALVMLLAACGATSEDERGSIGPASPAAEYCEGLGYSLVENACRFPDGTECPDWEFYRGSCGQEHSWCSQHGGVISSETQDMGTWTAAYAVCTIDGKRCKEDPLWRTGECEAPDQDAGQ